MSDRLTPLPLNRLLKWILTEYEKNDSILGIHKSLFFIPGEDHPYRMTRYGKLLETPVGVAAGPHTQLAQNIVVAWLCGARYMELKTIQTLDELEISKPCIDMEDEGYNCEWSQELKLRQSYEEYLNAWIIIHILKDRLKFPGYELGTIFNMSAGYNLEGILKPNVQEFLNLMKNSAPDLEEKLDQVSRIYPRVHRLNIPQRISDNLTISTMHGCPPDEIEKIGLYFIEERKYHTTIKLNPTLLGPEDLRDILHNKLRFNKVVVPDAAFEHDLKFGDAVPLIRNLQRAANEQNVQFSLKLTNTLEVENRKTFFPEKEQQSYLSGRALHPISINVARKLQTEFEGKLDISFSAGIDAFNVADVLACNIKPITTCTDVLKPGGYTRLLQYMENLERRFEETGAKSIEEFVVASHGSDTSVVNAGLSNLIRYARTVADSPAYQKQNSHFTNIKMERELTPFDCINAPCIGNCATGQDIPGYMYSTARGEFDEAFRVIMETNPMPGTTGHVCDHLCQVKCTRNNMDNSLLIREIKRFVTEKADWSTVSRISENAGKRAAIIGAGPSGLSCAYFLAMNGFEVQIFESQPEPGGMVSGAIPVFRLKDDTVDADISAILKLGVNIHYNSHVDLEKYENLRREFDFIYLSIGAQLNKHLRIPGENLPGVMEPLSFLKGVKKGDIPDLGSRIIIIGGGNTAIDAARTAKRLTGDKGTVTILYRRTRLEMPADHEEVDEAVQEGIILQERVAPEKIIQSSDGLELVCSRMKLGEKDESGRARPVKIAGSEFSIHTDLIIPAIGQDVEIEFPMDSDSGKAKVFAGGDYVRGASSVINAIGDGRKAAEKIIQTAGLENRLISDREKKSFTLPDYQKKLAHRQYGPQIHDFIKPDRSGFNLVSETLTEQQAIEEAERCLLCNDFCNICVSVCPNMANISYMAENRDYPVYEIINDNGQIQIEEVERFRITQTPQIINIGDFCNECGNCTTFCPTSGDPYKDKPRLYLSEDGFRSEGDGYFIHDGQILRKTDDAEDSLSIRNGNFVFSNKQLTLTLRRDTLEVVDAKAKENFQRINLKHLPEMVILLEDLPEYIFSHGDAKSQR